MPTTNTNFSTLITAIDTKAQSLAASTTDPKDLVYLGKAVEALNIPDTVSAIISEGDTQVGLVQTEGSTQVAAVQAAGSDYATLSGATFTGAVTIPDLTVTGTTTTINSTNLNVADANITIADGAADSAAADGAGITIDGASVNFQYSDSGKHMSLNKGLFVQEVKEKVALLTSTSGTMNVNFLDEAVLYLTNNQTANRTINFIGNSSTSLDSIMSVGQSITAAVLATQGSTAYYLDVYQVDGTTVTPKWQGGDAPTGGNASGIDVYTFTIIKTASATFTVLASQTVFA
jgi:hypothetical protein